MLSLDFEKEIQEIIRVLPVERNSYLFSATMTKKVHKLQKLSLKDPAMVEVSNKFQTPKVRAFAYFLFYLFIVIIIIK
jgi:ATP-dependent RNA helicase DDX47/RRP3